MKLSAFTVFFIFIPLSFSFFLNPFSAFLPKFTFTCTCTSIHHHPSPFLFAEWWVHFNDSRLSQCSFADLLLSQACIPPPLLLPIRQLSNTQQTSIPSSKQGHIKRGCFSGWSGTLSKEETNVHVAVNFHGYHFDFSHSFLDTNNRKCCSGCEILWLPWILVLIFAMDNIFDSWHGHHLRHLTWMSLSTFAMDATAGGAYSGNTLYYSTFVLSWSVKKRE